MRNEATWDALVVYLSLIIGIISNLFFFPKYLTEQQYGVYRFMMDTPQMFVPLLNVGASYAIYKFYPQFTKAGKIKGLLFPILTVVSVSFLSSFILYLIFQTDISDYYIRKNPSTGQYFVFCIPIILVLLYTNVLSTYGVVIKKTPITTFFSNFFVKLGTLILVICYGLLHFDFQYFLLGMVALLLVALLALTIYFYREKLIDFRPVLSMYKGGVLQKMMSYSAWIFMGSIGAKITNYVDNFMVSTMTDFSKGGVYSLAVIIAGIIEVPFNSVEKVSNTAIAKHWQKNEMQAIKSIYQDMSIDVFLLGAAMFICITANLDAIFEIMPNGEKYTDGIQIIFILGLGKLINMLFSMNGGIISFSKYFKFNLVVISILAGLTIALNLIFIPRFGYIGAAYGTLIAIFLFNIIKCIFIYYKFQLSLFTKQHIYTLSYVAIVAVVAYAIDFSISPYLSLPLKSLIISGLFAIGVLYLDISITLKDKVYVVLNKVKNIVSKSK